MQHAIGAEAGLLDVAILGGDLATMGEQRTFALRHVSFAKRVTHA